LTSDGLPIPAIPGYHLMKTITFILSALFFAFLVVALGQETLVLFNPVFNNGPGQWGHERVGARYFTASTKRLSFSRLSRSRISGHGVEVCLNSHCTTREKPALSSISSMKSRVKSSFE
jgi:hypothetical protein